MTDATYSTLWSKVMGWAITEGADQINKLPGLWTGSTPEYDVSINGHSESIDDVPPFNCRLVGTKYLVVAFVGPDGGGVGGTTERKLIKHFDSLAPSTE